MDELRDLARGGVIGGFVENPPSRVLSDQNVSGVSLRIDEYWLGWHTDRYFPFLVGGFNTGVREFQRHARMFRSLSYDFSQQPPDWVTHCRNRGYFEDAHPVAVVVILRHPINPECLADAPRRIGRHPIIYEPRPEAIGYNLRIGEFIGGSSQGTLGGFLWRPHDLAYLAMSCAHVLGSPKKGTVRAYSPKPLAFGKKPEIGTIVHAEFPLSPPNAKCNNRIQSNATDVDMALVELDDMTAVDIAVPRVGKVSRITPIANIGQGDLVQFFGFQSGSVSAKVKECNIWKEIMINGAPVCFGDLYVLDDVNYNYIATALAKPGDSGAWILNTTNGIVGWDGMLIGGDGSNVYCCYSENIMSHLRAIPAASNLVIPP